MRSTIAIFLLLLSISKGLSQGVHLNPGVDTTDVVAHQAIQFYLDYLSEFRGVKIPGDFCKYWSKEDCQKYEIPDPLIYGINTVYPLYSMSRSKTIIYVKPEKDRVTIRTAFGWTDSSKISLFCITKHYIQIDETGMKFIHPLDVNTKDWQSTRLRNVTFYYPSYHQYNSDKADSLISSVKKLEKEWDLEPIDISYYLADRREELERIKGFEFSLATGNRHKPSGIADDRNNVVYCSGLGENYFHEVVHIYLNRLFPSSSPVLEGVAGLYGGSMGQNLEWHINRLSTYLDEHPDIDLNKLDEFWYMDNQTNPATTIQGLICSWIYEKEGIMGLKRISEYATLEDIIVNEFDVKRDGINEFLRATLK